ncbi:MarR family winged helix-turn-helix transcriptional regulator [Bifidobacterium oedipodis]|uniref:MarR family transcriptional regulator n=1 Tax=Bifidobacterium oedipodis TaxID=2675322 RepID=A0A7Y0ER30_9BIFI|nr:MarR family transcriptional regulator [Bifidobacterium sp. DSM 109957]NMM94889.1 MarR family transcriptional regulator [Bifidobacterium sp. DSM 109957]
MGYEQEALDELIVSVVERRSQMRDAVARASKGEPFALRQLVRNGTMAPSQMASAMRVTSGRVSTMLASLEKKGLILRSVDPDDRRNVRIDLTDEGRKVANQEMEEAKDCIRWVFSQMGERRTREFTELVREFSTYMSICVPGKPRPTAEQVAQAFAAESKRESSAA